MEIAIQGSDQEVKTFQEVIGHYKISQEDLDQRIKRKNGFDDADKMFASYIAEGDWPYSSLIYDPRPYTTILEKSARLIGSKPKGRLVPREGGDTLGAYVNNELLDFEWDYNSCLGESMIAKWIMMDQNTRRYGSGFGLVPWRWDQRVMDGKKKTYYDGPDFRVLNNRDVLKNPSYTYINKWFSLREWKTLDELENINDAARSAPIYKNLNLLRDAIKQQMDGKTKGRGDQRSSKYSIPNKTIKGLTDYMGRDEVYKTVEVVTEFRPSRWITFAPRYGVVIRDIPNPYKHGEIPVVELKYYPLPDDSYGQSELEPISKLVRGLNAHLSSYSDRVALRLRPPVMVNATGVHMNTLEWTPEAKWLMNKPGQDVVNMPMGGSEDGAFQNVYNVFLGAIMNGVGEQSQGTSSINPTQDQGRVTATEIKDSAFTRNVRDNMNQIFLSEALKKQIMFWHSMNQQFLFAGKTDKAKVIRIVGKDAIAFFNRQGLGDIRPTEQDVANEAQYNPTGEGPSSYVPGPRYPVQVGDHLKPKFEADQLGEGGNLYIEPGDLIGEYDYIPDIESMKAPSDADIEQKMMMVVGMVTNPAVMQMMAAEGKKPKITEIIMRAIEATHVIKDAEGLFEDVQNGGVGNGQGQTLPGGIPGAAPGQPPQGANGPAGMAGGPPPMAPGQNQALMAGPPGNPVRPGPGVSVQNGMGMG